MDSDVAWLQDLDWVIACDSSVFLKLELNKMLQVSQPHANTSTSQQVFPSAPAAAILQVYGLRIIPRMNKPFHTDSGPQTRYIP